HRHARHGTGYRYLATEFIRPLPHDGQAVAVVAGRPEPGAVVADRYREAGWDAGQRHVAVPGAAELPGQVADQPLLGVAQRAVGRTVAEAADREAVGLQRDARGTAPGRADPGRADGGRNSRDGTGRRPGGHQFPAGTA